MKCTRRRFLTYTCICITSASLLLLLSNPFSLKAAVGESIEDEIREESTKKEPKEPKGVAEAFVKKLSENSIEKIKSMDLLYDVHLELEGYVKAKMSVVLEMKKEKNDYISIFSLTEPEGENLWSRFVIYVFGKHTDEYKQMLKAIETKLAERFHLKHGKFKTEEFKEILPDVKKYENQTGIKVYFDDNENLIKFWEDQTKEDYSKSIKYTNQVGPMTGFFNFVLFEEPEAEIYVINALKQDEAVGTPSSASRDRKQVKFLFGSQVVRLQRNDTGRHSEYANALYFEDQNFLDIIYGKNIYYHLAREARSNVKVPYALHVGGIISKKKKKEKEERVRRLMERELGHELFEEELRKIEAFDEFAAKDVKVYLRSAEAVIAE